MTATRVIAYTPNGASLGPLPSPSDVSVGYPLNDVGALTLNYAPDAARAALLGQPLELAVEVSWDQGLTWQEPASSRFLYLRDGRDPIKTGDAYQVEAAAYLLRLQKALVGFTGLNGEGNREFITQTPGAILKVLVDEAKARGALTGLAYDFTATQDSAGTPWPETIPQVAYEPGKDLLAILTEMAEMGLVDFRTQGRTVQVYVAGHASGMGGDRTVGAAPVALRFGRDLTEAPFRRTWEGLADTAMVKGDNGTHLERTNAAALKPWGRQETYVTASGVDDAGTLTVIADAALTLTEAERTEHTFGLEFGAAVHLPFRDYAPGEWVYAAVDGQAPQRMRVRQVTLTRDENGNTGGNVVLNDRFLEADVLQARRLNRLTQGATQGGTGTTPGSTPGVGPDILAPAAPTGLSATSSAYVESDGRVRSQISLDWNDVTTNADGSVASDVDHYEVQGRWVGLTEWKDLGTRQTSAWSGSPYDPGEDWEFRVRAVDTVFNRGGWSNLATVTTSADTVGPLKPATPTATSRLGTARIAWNGLRTTGEPMDPDFTHVTVHVSQVNGFTADDANRVGELGGAGYVVAGPLDYAATYYARLVPWDSSGNAGTPSDQVAITVAALVDVTNFPDSAMETLYARTGKFLDLTADNFSANLIEGMWLKAGTVEADRLAIGARGQTVMRNSYMEQADGTGKPLNWSVVWGYENTSLSGETASPISGTRSLKATVAGTTDPNSFIGDGGSEQPTSGGQKWYARVTVRAVQAQPARKVQIHGCTSTAASTPFGIFDPNVTWHAPGSAGEATGWTAGQVRTLETTFTVTNGHTKANIAIRLLNAEAAAGGQFVIDSVEMWPAVTDSQVTEVGAGKIKTGLLQATERIVAGSLTGARAELNGLGFQAFDAAGVKTFEVLASSGQAYFAGSVTTKAAGASGRVEVSAANNPYQSGQLWGALSFHSNNAAWDPGMLWAVYGSDSVNWGVLSIRGPRLGTRVPAAIDLRSEEQTNLTSIYLTAHEIRTSAETHLFGDPGKDIVTIKQNYTGSSTGQGFSFRSPGNKRIDFTFGNLGFNQINSKDESNAFLRLDLDAAFLYINPRDASGEIEFNGSQQQGNHVSLKRFNTNTSIVFSGGDPGPVRIKSWNGSVHTPIAASAFNVNSDVRHKTDEAEVVGALEGIRRIKAYDYDTPHGQAQKVSGRKGRKAKGKDGLHRYRQRGVMAQDVQAIWPDAVSEDDADRDGELSVDLYYLLTTAWAAIRELDQEVESLKAQNARLKP